MLLDDVQEARARARTLPLNVKFGHAEAILHKAILRDYAGRIALVSSFGADSVVLLDMVAKISPATPVLLNETGMLFPETLEYQREIVAKLGLTNVRLIRPTSVELRSFDPEGSLHQNDPNACCDLRKTRPLLRALKPYEAWITGRKRHQSTLRAELSFSERDDAGRIKLNPLVDWDASDLNAYIDERALPRHPLVAKGFASIGCTPCTTPVTAGEDPRAGRWRDEAKDECGIHLTNGRWMRGTGEGI